MVSGLKTLIRNLLQKVISGNTTRVLMPGHKKQISVGDQELSQQASALAAKDILVPGRVFLGLKMISGNTTPMAIPGPKKHLSPAAEDMLERVSLSEAMDILVLAMHIHQAAL